MRATVYSGLRFLFILSLCTCMLLGASLTLAQLTGVILHSPVLLAQSEALLLKPTMVAAAAFGLISFISSYFSPAVPVEADEDGEI